VYNVHKKIMPNFPYNVFWYVKLASSGKTWCITIKETFPWNDSVP